MGESQKGHVSSQNAEFFADNASYTNSVHSLQTYRNIRAEIDREIAGVGRLLDVGNGGIFDYDVSLAQEVVGVDLFVPTDVEGTLPSHVTVRRGDALDLPEPDASYDCVLYALVMHHLTEEDPDGMEKNTRTALTESLRVLKPGGKLVIAESCIPAAALPLERVLFRPLYSLTRRGVFAHPPTLQLPVGVLEDMIQSVFGNVISRRIEVGSWILQFGHRWPTWLTPARPWMLVAHKHR